MRIEVPKSRQLIATTEGVLLRRRLKADGKPEAVPFYPHEFMSRQSSFGDEARLHLVIPISWDKSSVRLSYPNITAWMASFQRRRLDHDSTLHAICAIPSSSYQR